MNLRRNTSGYLYILSFFRMRAFIRQSGIQGKSFSERS